MFCRQNRHRIRHQTHRILQNPPPSEICAGCCLAFKEFGGEQFIEHRRDICSIGVFKGENPGVFSEVRYVPVELFEAVCRQPPSALRSLLLITELVRAFRHGN